MHLCVEKVSQSECRLISFLFHQNVSPLHQGAPREIFLLIYFQRDALLLNNKEEVLNIHTSKNILQNIFPHFEFLLFIFIHSTENLREYEVIHICCASVL